MFLYLASRGTARLDENDGVYLSAYELYAEGVEICTCLPKTYHKAMVQALKVVIKLLTITIIIVIIVIIIIILSVVRRALLH
jgi:hypothetical protein